MDRWLEAAERKAGVEKLEGGLWHPYRRKWATERKHHLLKDVAAAGGWKDVGTLLTCYTAADDETVLGGDEREAESARRPGGAVGQHRESTAKRGTKRARAPG
jgi:hypothetical protein